MRLGAAERRVAGLRARRHALIRPGCRSCARQIPPAARACAGSPPSDDLRLLNWPAVEPHGENAVHSGTARPACRPSAAHAAEPHGYTAAHYHAERNRASSMGKRASDTDEREARPAIDWLAI